MFSRSRFFIGWILTSAAARLLVDMPGRPADAALADAALDMPADAAPDMPSWIWSLLLKPGAANPPSYRPRLVWSL